jgi:hypothetical protein
VRNGECRHPLKDVELLLVLRSHERKPPGFSTDGPYQNNPSSQLLSDACVGRCPSQQTGFPQKSPSAPAAEYSPFCPRHGRLRFSSSAGAGIWRDPSAIIFKHGLTDNGAPATLFCVKRTQSTRSRLATRSLAPPLGPKCFTWLLLTWRRFQVGANKRPRICASLASSTPAKDL